MQTYNNKTWEMLSNMDPRDYKAEKTKELLRKIGMLESSGGIDTDHKEVTRGPQSGDTAIGEYGLMPNTLEEFSERYPSDVTEGMDKQQLVQRAKEDPEFARTMAATMASHLKNKRGLSDDETAAAWEAGHNLPKEKIQKKLNTNRAKKFKVLDSK